MAHSVQQLMTPYPIVVDETTPVSHCARLMDDRDIGALGVMRDGEIVGVLTDRDIAVRAVGRERDPRETTAGEIATKDVVSVPLDATVDEAERRMIAHAVRRLFVVTEDGGLHGILTLDDLVAFRDPESIVAQQIREYGIVRGDMGFTRGV
jgi:CBS domain-containing protein